MRNSVVVTGGGTGGHLKVADSFIDELYKRDIDIIFIGSSNGLDKEWFADDKRLKKSFFLDTKGVVNKKGFGKIQSLLNIFFKTKDCLNIFSQYGVNKVISVGGFSAAPATFASILSFRCKLFIHEQNSKMGRLNEITSKFAKEVYCSFDKESSIKDYPVANEFFDNARIREDIKTIIFLGGSQGAKAINDFALNIASKLDKKGISIIHQTGRADFERVENSYKHMNLNVDVFAFSKEISKKMNKADFAVSRSGASTLWELCANCLPTLFIPYPYAAKDHQFTNAKFLEEKNLCYVCREKNIDDDYFLELLEKNNNKISKDLKSSIRKNGVKLIVDEILYKY